MATTVKHTKKTKPNSSYTYSQLENLWIKAGGSKQTAPTMAAIALAESGGNPRATHTNSDGTVDRGLWQINSSNAKLYSGRNIYNPLVNVAVAMNLATHGQGLNNWTSYRTGAYKSNLPKTGSGDFFVNPTLTNLKHILIGGGGGDFGTGIGVGTSTQQTATNPTKAIPATGKAAKNAVVNPTVSALTTAGQKAMFALVIAGGGALLLLGLALIGADLGLSAFATMRNGKTFNRGQKLVRIPAHRRARKATEARSAELHGQRVRAGEAKIAHQEARTKTEKARATELRTRTRHRAAIAKASKKATEQERRKAMYEGATAAQQENLRIAKARERRARRGKKVA